MNKESEECVVNSVFFFIHSAVMAPLSPSLVSVYTLLLYEAGEDILKKWAMCCIGKITGVTVEGRAVKNVQSGVALGKYPPSKYFIEFRMKFEGIYFLKSWNQTYRSKVMEILNYQRMPMWAKYSWVFHFVGLHFYTPSIFKSSKIVSGIKIKFVSTFWII